MDLFSKSKKGLSNAFPNLEVSDTKFLEFVTEVLWSHTQQPQKNQNPKQTKNG